MKKIAFFDIDGTLTSEIDGSLPKSAINAIRHARTFGHLMFINTGRCFQNVEPRFRRIGFERICLRMRHKYFLFRHRGTARCTDTQHYHAAVRGGTQNQCGYSFRIQKRSCL